MGKSKFNHLIKIGIGSRGNLTVNEDLEVHVISCNRNFSKPSHELGVATKARH